MLVSSGKSPTLSQIFANGQKLLVKSPQWPKSWEIYPSGLANDVEAAESELMTGIVAYATSSRFMAKKIPQSDL